MSEQKPYNKPADLIAENKSILLSALYDHIRQFESATGAIVTGIEIYRIGPLNYGDPAKSLLNQIVLRVEV